MAVTKPNHSGDKPNAKECNCHPQESVGSASLSLHALTAAALALPGLAASPAHAIGVDGMGFQYGHYEETKRRTYGVQSNLNPIQVDSLQGSGQMSLADRLKFAFNFTQDTWGGATPVATAPLAFGGNHKNTVSGASPYLSIGTVRLDAQLNPLRLDPKTGKYSKDTQLVHTLAMASPETRKQGDFKFAYEWDEATLDIGGGISVENDYTSGFGNALARMDFNQKQTSAILGLSFTNSDINATLDHDATPYIYETSGGLKTYNQTHSGSQIDIVGGSLVNHKILRATRQDWASNLSLTQVLNKDAMLVGSLGFTRNTGYLANPYKAVTTVFIDPKQTPAANGVLTGNALSLLENRPDERNQWIANMSYVQHIDALGGSALHADYRFYSDDWGINSHTFEVDWAQPVYGGLVVTPMFRYYSQDAADFFQNYLVSFQEYPGRATVDRVTKKVTISPLNPAKLPANYSSDQRLSAFGTISTGITFTKRFAKGISLEAGAEYYTHAGSLKMGGGGEGSFADFNYYRVNAGIQVDMSAVALPALPSGGGASADDHSGHAGHDGHNAHRHGVHGPSGVLFDHMLSKAGDFMIGYRYMWSSQNGDMLHGTNFVSDKTLVNEGCYDAPCYVTPSSMNMNMHMLDLMYAPLDWMTLMVMPQFVDMNMNMRPLDGAPSISNADPVTSAAVMHSYHTHQTGGVSDVGMYSLFKLLDKQGHHIHATFGISAPTGDVGIQLRNTHGVNIGFIHYGMQLGSGTWDFRPSVTYTGQTEDWSWGAQLNGIHRLENQNTSGFAFGDILQATAWGSYNLLDWLSASLRGVYTVQGAIKGVYNNTYTPIGPMDYTNNYGGRYWDIGIGISAMVPTGNLKGNQFGFEWIQPVHDDVNGYQLERTGALAASWGYAF